MSYTSWAPDNRYYTRESHVKKISTNNGTTVVFNTLMKDSAEFYVPNRALQNGRETMANLRNLTSESQVI